MRISCLLWLCALIAACQTPTERDPGADNAQGQLEGMNLEEGHEFVDDAGRRWTAKTFGQRDVNGMNAFLRACAPRTTGDIRGLLFPPCARRVGDSTEGTVILYCASAGAGDITYKVQQFNWFRGGAKQLQDLIVADRAVPIGGTERPAPGAAQYAWAVVRQ